MISPNPAANTKASAVLWFKHRTKALTCLSSNPTSANPTSAFGECVAAWVSLNLSLA